MTLFTGHLALDGILAAFGLTGEVINIPITFTFTSTTNAIARCGCKPVFCNIDPESYTLDPLKIECLFDQQNQELRV